MVTYHIGSLKNSGLWFSPLEWNGFRDTRALHPASLLIFVSSRGLLFSADCPIRRAPKWSQIKGFLSCTELQ